MFKICSLLVLIFAASLVQAEIAGPIRVIDGDTFAVGEVRVRLHGIDTPEADQRCGGNGVPAWHCGQWVSTEVRRRYQGKRAVCERIETDRYGREVARCLVGGEDVGRALVRDGLAFAYREYSMAYDLDEKGAVVQGVGLHGSGAERPSLFRSTLRAGQAAANLAEAPTGCTIKGNISAKGERIYHLPGQEHYEKTRISLFKGERWFCSEAAARQAGWRRAKR